VAWSTYAERRPCYHRSSGAESPMLTRSDGPRPPAEPSRRCSLGARAPAAAGGRSGLRACVDGVGPETGRGGGPSRAPALALRWTVRAGGVPAAAALARPATAGLPQAQSARARSAARAAVGDDGRPVAGRHEADAGVEDAGRAPTLAGRAARRVKAGGARAARRTSEESHRLVCQSWGHGHCH
jgi:hypothetical protein